VKRWWWIVLGATCGVSIANVVSAVAFHRAWWLITPALGLVVPFAVAGFIFGRWLFQRELASAFELVSCVGGPMDGMRLPPPPKNVADSFVRVEEFPEGAYRYDGETFVWEED
jgi:uncharacterized membrane protein YeaQ/YmgE (transglycosylase-associated protein family)